MRLRMSSAGSPPTVRVLLLASRLLPQRPLPACKLHTRTSNDPKRTQSSTAQSGSEELFHAARFFAPSWRRDQHDCRLYDRPADHRIRAFERDQEKPARLGFPWPGVKISRGCDSDGGLRNSLWAGSVW